MPAETSLIRTDVPWLNAASTTAEAVVSMLPRSGAELGENGKIRRICSSAAMGNAPGRGRFAAHVDEVGPVANHCRSMSDRGVG